MHSRFELFVPLAESDELISLFNEIVLKIEILEKTISRFVESSQTSKLNQNACIAPVTVNEEFFHLAEQCVEFKKKTFGCFDIAATKSSGSNKNSIILNREDKTISFETEEVKIDFGAVGKGLALEIAIDLIKKSGICNALINFGDSSVYGLGNHPNGHSWPITISKGQNNIRIDLNNNALSSSGLHTNSSDMAHIFNPLTGNLISKDEKVIVVSNSPFVAEVLSTAVYAADEIIREAIKKEFTHEEFYII
jgi:thiamine biosynthesis lipoprotein